MRIWKKVIFIFLIDKKSFGNLIEWEVVFILVTKLKVTQFNFHNFDFDRKWNQINNLISRE